MTAGERIRAARLAKNLTQNALGNCCGIAEPTIRRYELGKLNPKPCTLQKIADAVVLPLSFFQATPPFEDLQFLAEYKSVILPSLESRGFIDLAGRPLVDIGNYEYWKFVADHIASIIKLDTDLLSIQYTQTHDVETEVVSFTTWGATLDFGSVLQPLIDSGFGVKAFAILRNLGTLNEYGITAAERNIIDLTENPDYRKI